MEKTLEELPEILSVDQAAKYLNVCRATAYNWCKAGDLQSFKVGNTRRIPKTALIQVLTRSGDEAR